MAYDTRLREEEIKNKLRQDYFAGYDATEIIDDIDFAVAIPRGKDELDFETEYFLWAEAKKGTTADIHESFAQFIITFLHQYSLLRPSSVDFVCVNPK